MFGARNMLGRGDCMCVCVWKRGVGRGRREEKTGALTVFDAKKHVRGKHLLAEAGGTAPRAVVGFRDPELGATLCLGQAALCRGGHTQELDRDRPYHREEEGTYEQCDTQRGGSRGNARGAHGF